jgi:FixJ family two-component response regulator
MKAVIWLKRHETKVQCCLAPVGITFPLVDTARPLIVIVDDEDCIRRALSRLMISAGFRAQAFGSGEEFFASLQATRPDCVILDLHMPAMSGFDIQERLRTEQNPIPVVVITGHDSTESQQRALSAGAVAYLRKPVDDQALLAAISNAVSTAPNGRP